MAKLDDSAFDGSMCGAGAHVFAVWFYALSKARGWTVILVAPVIAAEIGCSEQEVVKAIDWLSEPNDANPNERDGRRLVRIGHTRWEIIGSGKPLTEEEQRRREYMREAKRKERAEAATPAKQAKSPAAKKPAPRKMFRRVPDTWAPTLKHQELAADLGVDIDAELEKFRDHEFRDPKTDADACFRTWIRNAAKYNRGGFSPTARAMDLERQGL